MTARILVVDDEVAIRRLLSGALARAGETIAEAGTAAEALALMRSPELKLVLLDLGLPDRDGLELVPLIKAADRAVIVLTARNDTEEKVAALDLGADDYVTKPFDTAELLARVRVALRNQRRVAKASMTLGSIRFEESARRITRDGVEVRLTPKEFALFAELARHPGRVMTHGHLLSTIWGKDHIADVEYLRVTVRSLRSKLEPDPARPRMVVNDPGIGYRLTVG